MRRLFRCAYDVKTFAGARQAMNAELPYGIEEIGRRCFLCSELRRVEIPRSVTKIGDSAFCNCRNLRHVELNDSLKTLGGDGTSRDGVFEDTVLEDVKIPSTVECMGDRAFYGCKNLTGLDIPDGLAYIGGDCFCGIGLTSIMIPASLKVSEARSTTARLLWWSSAEPRVTVCSRLASVSLLARCQGRDSPAAGAWKNWVRLFQEWVKASSRKQRCVTFAEEHWMNAFAESGLSVWSKPVWSGTEAVGADVECSFGTSSRLTRGTSECLNS